jgi:hypothetical protein
MSDILTNSQKAVGDRSNAFFRSQNTEREISDSRQKLNLIPSHITLTANFWISMHHRPSSDKSKYFGSNSYTSGRIKSTNGPILELNFLTARLFNHALPIS